MKREQPKHLLRRAEPGRFDAVPFFTVLAVLTAVAFILPLRPTESIAEKRKLAAFPAFSMEALWSGTYFDDINLWFSDTFPGREGYIAVSGKLERLHGLNRNRVSGAAAGRVKNDDLDALLNEAEAPKPSLAPAVTATPAPTPEPTPTPIDPNAELTDWAGFDAQDELDMFGSTMVLGKTIVVTQGFSQDCSDYHVRLMNRIGDALAERDIRFFNLPAPTSVGVLFSSDMLEKLGCADQGKMLRYMFAQENENVIPVNAFNTLIAHNDEYIYYNSDHHWTALGAYYAYDAFCRAAGFEPVPLSAYREVNMGRFLGTYYMQMNGLVDTSDEMIAYVPPGETRMEIPLYPNLTSVIVDETDGYESMKYNCFIGGDNPVTTLINDSIPDGPTCVVLKDSFGNPFCVYLTQHYHKVVVLDYRDAGITLTSAAEKYGASDVILLQSIGVSQNWDALRQLDAMLR